MKKSLFVDRGKLESAIRLAEKDGPLGNRGLLWKKTAEVYNKNRGDAPEITFSVVLLRVGEWNLPLKTPRGKKGRGTMSPEQKAAQVKLMQAARVAGGPRVKKSEKFAKDPAAANSLVHLKQYVPERFQPLYEKVKGGSRGAAVKLYCLSCANWQTQEVTLCPVLSCPLHVFRPYQRDTDADDAEPEPENNSDESEE